MPHTYILRYLALFFNTLLTLDSHYKCLDDWKDDRNLTHYLYALSLKKHYQDVKEAWPRQCEAIEKELDALSQIEQSKSTNPDAAANSFGRLMEELFVMRQDE